MTVARTAADVLAGHVTLEIESIDRMYLNLYVPPLQRELGVVGFFKSWVPSGTPKPLLVILIPVEVLSQFARIISLAVRLFANLLAGHLVIAVFLALAGILTSSALYWLIQPIGLAFGAAIYTLEVTLIAGLQAFIFATLSAIYIGGAIHPDH